MHDCGFLNPQVTKILWSGFEGKWPAAHAFLVDFQVDAKDQAAMMRDVDQKNLKLDDVTSAWVENNEEKWKPWIDSARN